MKQIFRYTIALLMLVLSASTSAQDANILSIADVSGSMGSQVALPIHLSNTCNDIVALQFRLTLSNGLTLDTSSAQFGVRTSNHAAVVQKNGNSYVVMVFSSDNSVIAGNAGQLMTIVLNIPTGLTPGGEYPLTLSEVLLSNKAGENVLTSFNSGTLHIAEVTDFVVTDVQSTTEGDLAPGDAANVAWTVKNQGGLASTGGWSEQILLVGNNGRTVLLGTVFHDEPLVAGATVSRQTDVLIPALPGIDGAANVQVKLLPNADSGEMTEYQANNTTLSSETVMLSKILKLTMPQTVVEGGNTLKCVLTRSGSWVAAQTFNISVEGDARLGVPATVTIPRGQSSTTFYITINDDDIMNTDSHFVIQASGNGYEPVTADLEMEDNEYPALTLTASKTDITEGETFQLTVKRNSSVAEPLTVMLTCESSKHFEFPTLLTIPAGESSTIVNVKAIDDADIYDVQSIAFVASAEQHAKAEVLVVLTDNDMPELQLVLKPQSVSENAGTNAVIGVLSRSGNLDSKVTLQLTDDSNGLLTYSSKTLTLKKGEREVKFGLGVTDDLLVNGDREVTMTAAIYVSSCNCYATGETSGSVSQKITVLDNDGPTLLITPSASVFLEGSENNSLTISRNAYFDTALTVNISSDFDSMLSYDHTAVIEAGQTSVTIPVSVSSNDVEGDDHAFTFTVTADGFTKGTCWSMVSDQSLPDATITSLSVNNAEAEAESEINISVTVKNVGNSLLQRETPMTVYLDDAAVLALKTSKILSPGEETTIEASYTQPAKTGHFSLMAVVNPTKRISELLYTNNSSASIPITIVPCLNATAKADKDVYQQGETITISGKATGTKGANAKLEIYLINEDTRQTITATADSDGNYTTEWTPLKGQAGHFVVGACYPGEGKTDAMDEFDVYGFKTSGFRATCQFGEGDTYTGQIYITNPGVLPQTGIHIEPQATSDNCEFTFSEVEHLEGGQSAYITYNIKGNGITQGYSWQQMPLVVKSNEGSTAAYKLYYYVMSQRGSLRATTSQIKTTMTLGVPREYPLTIWNAGKGETGTITLALPSMIESVTPRTMPSLASGDSVNILLRFIPTEQMKANMPVTGKIGINCRNGYGIPVFFELTPVSEAKGTLTIDVVDDFTYYTAESPHVNNAKVKVVNRATRALVAEGMTADNGCFAAEMNEGVYRVTVEADNHLSQTRDVIVDPGTDNKEEVFLSYDAITYEWKVEETTVDDEYSIETIVKFDTRVPQPVVVVSYPDECPEPGSIFPVTVTNKGFINANDVGIHLRIKGGGYSLEFLNDPSIEVLAPQQSVVFYAKIKRTGSESRRANIEPVLIECVEMDGGAYYTFDCGPFANRREVPVFRAWGRCPSSHSGGGSSGGYGYSGVGRPWGYGNGYVGSNERYSPYDEAKELCEKDEDAQFKLIEVNEKGEEVSKKEWRGVAADGVSRVKLVLDRSKYEKAFGSDFEITNVRWSMPEGNKYGSLDNLNSIEPIFTAPADFPFDTMAPSYTIPAFVYFEVNGFEQEAKVDIEVTRVPLIFLHGFNSNNNCWEAMERALVNKGDGIYDDYQVLNKSYQSWSSFEANTTVVKEMMTTLKHRYNSKKIVFKKADVVGHSMGGILARLHVQYVDNTNIHKIITVNTPHSGSEWGDVMYFFSRKLYSSISDLVTKNKISKEAGEKNKKELDNFMRKLTEKAFGTQWSITNIPFALFDLAVNSDPMDIYLNGLSDMREHTEKTKQILNRINNIPVRAITTTTNYTEPLDFFVGASAGLALFCFGTKGCLKGALEYIGIIAELEQALSFGQSDLVVSLESQKGGLNGLMGPNASKNKMHMGSASDVDVMNMVKLSLLAPSGSDFFSHSGFNPNNRIMSSAKWAEAVDDWFDFWEHLSPIENPNSSRSVRRSNEEDIHINITAHIEGDSLKGNCIVNNEENVDEISIFIEIGDELHSFNTKDFAVAIPTTFSGTIATYAYVETNNYEIVSDSIFVNVNHTRAVPSSIICDDLIYDIRRNTAPLLLKCQWNDGSITNISPDAVTFSNPIAQYVTDSLLLLSVGKTDMIINYGGLTCNGHLTIIGDGYDGIDEDAEEETNSVCVGNVSLKIEQRAVMTRQAFRGTLTVNNGHPTLPLTDMKVNIEVRDANGMLATAHEFQMDIESLSGFAGNKQFDAGWSLSPKESGTATILFIPTKYAAPTEPQEWSFGGSFSYTDPYTGLTVTRELNPVTLTVNPTPILDFTYFMQRDILGDDPLTEEIEPMEPAEFAIIVNNKGHGSTQGMKMTTDQPQIVDNEKGLAVNFEIISTQMNGQEKTLALGQSMTTDFGTIAPLSQAYAQWWLQSSLLGHFVEYDIKATHVTSHNNPDLSLLENVTIHELIRGFTPEGMVNDSQKGRGFLVNDVEDTKDLPDEVYFTDGTQQHVVVTDNITVSKIAGNSYGLHVIPTQTGWNYGAVADPTNGRAVLKGIVRQSDGTTLPLDNIWQTDRTLRDGKDPLYEYRLHFVGDMSNGENTYLLTFEPKPEVELAVDSIIGLPKEGVVLTAPLESVQVRFNKPIDDSTFTTEDLTLTCQSNRTPTGGILITKVNDTTFDLNLTEAVQDDGFYTLTVQTADITDAEGFNGSVGKQAMWTQYCGQPMLKVVVSPENAGIVTPAGGRFDYDRELTLTATPAEGYTFAGWSTNDETLSTKEVLTYHVMGNAELTALFTPKHYEVQIDYDEGLGKVENGGTGFYDYNTHLCLVAKPAENCLFKGWTVNGERLPESENTLNITVSQNLDIRAEFVRDYYDQTLTLAKGWNWVSSYLGDSQMLEQVCGNANRILGQTDELILDPQYGLVGNMSQMIAGRAYKVEALKAFSTTLSGHLYNVESSPLLLNTGWNWIAFPYYEDMSLNIAVANAEDGDYVVSQRGFAEFAAGKWEGTLNTLSPGKGYLYKSASDKTLAFDFSSGGYNSQALARAFPADAGQLESVDIHRYPNTMNMTIQVYKCEVNLSTDNLNIYAFAGDELRGVSQQIGNNHYLTVYGNGPVEISFIVESADTGETFETTQTLAFRDDVVGSRKSPYILQIDNTTGIESVASDARPMTVYSMEGILMSRDATKKALKQLPKGVYIVNGKKCFVK